MRRIVWIMLGLLLPLALSGCNEKEENSEFQVYSMGTYDRIEYSYLEVVREDLQSVVNLALNSDNYEVVSDRGWENRDSRRIV